MRFRFATWTVKSVEFYPMTRSSHKFSGDDLLGRRDSLLPPRHLERFACQVQSVIAATALRSAPARQPCSLVCRENTYRPKCKMIPDGVEPSLSWVSPPDALVAGCVY